MNETALFQKINSLPKHLKEEVQDFVDSLLAKKYIESENKDRNFGCLKGQIQMSTDFDAPIEDFKDYM